MSLPQPGARRVESADLTRALCWPLEREKKHPAQALPFSSACSSLSIRPPPGFTAHISLACLQCITDDLRARGINVSTALPDDVLYFVRRHPLMSQQIQPVDRRPLLFRRTTDYTHMAVEAVRGIDGETYHVIYLGTGVCPCVSSILV